MSRSTNYLIWGLDGIVISTPNDQHANQAQQALNNGVAVFCQKPIGRNTVETAAVIEAAYRADRLIAADFCYRFTTGMQRIRETISAGVLASFMRSICAFITPSVLTRHGIMMLLMRVEDVSLT